MDLATLLWTVLILLLIFRHRIAAFMRDLQSKRHRFKLAVQKEKTKQEKTKAMLLREQNRKAALELRAAELEIEWYDRRVTGSPPDTTTPTGVDPDDL